MTSGRGAIHCAHKEKGTIPCRDAIHHVHKDGHVEKGIIPKDKKLNFGIIETLSDIEKNR